MASGRAKSSGLSPWKTPFDVAFIGGGHICPEVVFVTIVEEFGMSKSNQPVTLLPGNAHNLRKKFIY